MSKPIIGSRYARPWFESRDSNGTYAAFNAGMSMEDFALQKALLNVTSQPVRLFRPFRVAAALLAGAAFYFVTR